jgi:hypothetical protein
MVASSISARSRSDRTIEESSSEVRWIDSIPDRSRSELPSRSATSATVPILLSGVRSSWAASLVKLRRREKEVSIFSRTRFSVLA